MNDLEQFRETFISEASELSEEMENKLLNLDVSSPSMDDINAIFRCAHSIKGGAGSFGFTRLVGFTHILEYLLDALRNNQIQANDDIVDALLKSVDILKAFITAAQAHEEAEEGIEDELLARLKTMSEAVPSASNTPAPVKQNTESKPQAVRQKENEVSGYRIRFIPYKELFASGNEPLYIIRELQRNCENIKIKCDTTKIPSASEAEAMDCYLSWEILVSTKDGLNKIKEAFEFVEGECSLEITELQNDNELAGAETKNKTTTTTESDDGSWGLFEDYAAEAKKKNAEIQDNSGAWGLFDDPATQTTASQNTNVAEIKNAVPKPAPKPQAQAENGGQQGQPAVSSIRVDIHKIDRMVNMVGELVITQAMIMQKLKDIPPQYLEKLMQGVNELSRHTREIQEAVMAVRMQPVKSIFSRMPRLVRDLAKKLNKQARIEMKGENTEIDKTVIELLSDPLTHMIRNSVDHGIEMPDERAKAGKAEEGVVYLSADSAGGRIIIEISDDGKGINREKVLKKAIERGLVAPEATLSPEEIDALIFLPGFSTAEKVTDVSGRGVGMDVVRKNIKDLGGEINMVNTPGFGTNFQISLPLTLAILDGMIIRVGAEKYILPISNILETMQVNNNELMHVRNGEEVINVRGEFIPIIYLYRIFNINGANTNISKPLVVLVESGRNKFGVVVDELLGQQQVVIKNLEENSNKVDGISGATILGDGNVSLILDVAQIFKLKSPAPDVKKAA